MGPFTDDDMITDVDHPTPGSPLVVNDWFWTGAPDPILIPWTWLSMPLSLRQDAPINSAQITGLSGVVAQANNTAAQNQFGTFSASGTLTTALQADAANFGQFLVTYYGNPLLRCPTWTFDLTGPQFYADENKWKVLGRELGDRVTLTSSTLTDSGGTTVTLPVPAGLPAAARNLTIEGIQHASSPTVRTVTWTTGPLLGPTPGVEGPWFRLDYSFLGGTDARPF
jgi:hypothetical protein